MPTFEITTTIGCPLMCTICPQDNLIKNYGKNEKYMSFENFKLFLNKIPKFVRIDFSGMVEPWANEECTQMLQYTLENGYNIAIYTTLFGMRPNDVDLSIEYLKKYKSQVEIVMIHLPDKNKNMRGWKNTSEYHYALKKSLQLKNIINLQYMTMDRNGDVHDDIKNYNIQLVDWYKNDWLGTTKAGSLNLNEINTKIVLPTPQHFNPVSCASTPFYDHNVLLPNGDVVLCCMDYSMKHKIGNLFNQSYDDLYLSNEMINLMKENKKFGYSKCSICKSCTNAKIHSLSNTTWIT